MKPASTVNTLAARGAIAAAVALVITTALTLQRPYWVIMIAVVLVNQTTGQSLRRSGERLAATFAGFALGWALQWITTPHRWVQIGIMMGAVFLAVFFRQSWGRGSFRWMTFFISLYVVFLFALLGEWSPSIFVVRIYDTFLGAGAALFATYVVPSPGSRARLLEEAESLWNRCRTELWTAVNEFTERDGRLPQQHAAYLLQLDTLRSHAEEALYETFLSPAARREALDRFATAGMLCYLALGLLDAMACGANSPERVRLRKPLLDTMGPVANATFQDFDPPPGSRKTDSATPTRPEVCRFATEQFRNIGMTDFDRVWAMPALYYAGALCAALKADARARLLGSQEEANARSLLR